MHDLCFAHVGRFFFPFCVVICLVVCPGLCQYMSRMLSLCVTYVVFMCGDAEIRANCLQTILDLTDLKEKMQTNSSQNQGSASVGQAEYAKRLEFYT